MSKTLHEIEAAIGTLPLPERLRLYKDMPQWIGRNIEDLEWQRLGLENFFQDANNEEENWADVLPSREVEPEKLDLLDGK